MDFFHHNGIIDFDALFNQSSYGMVPFDSDDLADFAADAAEIHSFCGSSDSNSRIEAALNAAFESTDAKEILGRCMDLALVIKHNPDAEQPLLMEEVSSLQTFLSSFPEEPNLQWGLMEDTSIGNRVDVIVLCKLKSA